MHIYNIEIRNFENRQSVTGLLLPPCKFGTFSTTTKIINSFVVKIMILKFALWVLKKSWNGQTVHWEPCNQLPVASLKCVKLFWH